MSTVGLLQDEACTDFDKTLGVNTIDYSETHLWSIDITFNPLLVNTFNADFTHLI